VVDNNHAHTLAYTGSVVLASLEEGRQGYGGKVRTRIHRLQEQGSRVFATPAEANCLVEERDMSTKISSPAENATGSNESHTDKHRNNTGGRTRTKLVHEIVLAMLLISLLTLPFTVEPARSQALTITITADGTVTLQQHRFFEMETVTCSLATF